MQSRRCVIANNSIKVGAKTWFEVAPELEFAHFAKLALKNLGITYPKFYKMDRLCRLGFLAAEYLLAQNPDLRPDERTAIVLCNSSSSFDSDLLHQTNIDQPSPAVFVYTLPNIVAGEISIRHGIKGETAFFVGDRDDGYALQYAVNLLTNGRASACVAGWVDYTESEYCAELYWIA